MFKNNSRGIPGDLNNYIKNENRGITSKPVFKKINVILN